MANESKLTISTGGSANGDGMDLYNSVMLPKLPEWDKETYSYLVVSKVVQNGSTGYFLTLSSVPLYFNTGNINSSGLRTQGGVLYSYKRFIVAPDEGAASIIASLLGVSSFPVNQWYHFSDGSKQLESGVMALVSYSNDLLWSSYDVQGFYYANETTHDWTYSGTYLSASDPIPLDGMNVIEWDGDTTGLTSVLDMFHKVSDATPTEAQLSGGYAVFNNQDGTPTYPLVSGETLATDGDIVVILDGAFVAAADGASLEGVTIPEKGIYFAGYDGAYCSILAYRPASSGGGVTDTTATVNFSCKDLLYTDSVYRIKAWVYKVADGLDVTLAPTWTSDLFAGLSHSESHTFTGLTPATEYGIYAVIEENGVETENTAQAGFTTTGEPEPEEPVTNFDHDAFCLGLASGLSGTGVLRAGGNHNNWLQGYLAGLALRGGT